MDSTLKLEVSGVSMSSLEFEMMNCHGDQEGLLFGNTRTKVVDDINDTEKANYDSKEFIISIHQNLPCAQTHSFYNRQGDIDEARLKDVLSSHRLEDLIGWYRFRRNSPMEVYFQEQVIHQNLMDLLPKDRRSYFLFGIFTFTLNTTIHTIDHCFLRQNGEKFESVSAKVINLGDTAHTGYKTDPPLVLDRDSGSYSHLFHSIKPNIINNEGRTASVKFIQDIQEELAPKFKKLCRHLGDTELELSRLSEEIKCAREASKKNKCTEGENSERKASTALDTVENQLSEINLTEKTKLPGELIEESPQIKRSEIVFIARS